MAARFSSDDTKVRAILGIIFDLNLRSGCISLGELDNYLYRERIPGLQFGSCRALGELIQDYPDVFEITISQSGDEEITVNTQLDICQEHCSKSGCPIIGCQKLHVCKFFILNDTCKFNYPDNPCEYGHSLDSNHNHNLLCDHFLDCLRIDALRILLKKGLSQTSIPKICKFYNVGAGCRGGDRCPFLHLCKYYLKDKCGFGIKCKRSHNVFDSQPKRILEEHGIKTARSPKEVLKELRELLKDEDGERSVPSTSRSMVMPRQHNPFQADPNSCHRSNSFGEDSEDTPEICMFSLRGKCSYGSACKNIHKDKRYIWQYKKGGVWNNWVEKISKHIEKNYCDVKKDSVTVKLPKCERSRSKSPRNQACDGLSQRSRSRNRSRSPLSRIRTSSPVRNHSPSTSIPTSPGRLSPMPVASSSSPKQMSPHTGPSSLSLYGKQSSGQNESEVSEGDEIEKDSCLSISKRAHSR